MEESKANWGSLPTGDFKNVNNLLSPQLDVGKCSMKSLFEMELDINNDLHNFNWTVIG